MLLTTKSSISLKKYNSLLLYKHINKVSSNIYCNYTVPVEPDLRLTQNLNERVFTGQYRGSSVHHQRASCAATYTLSRSDLS